jgi:hypothetical protein
MKAVFAMGESVVRPACINAAGSRVSAGPAQTGTRDPKPMSNRAMIALFGRFDMNSPWAMNGVLVRL